MLVLMPKSGTKSNDEGVVDFEHVALVVAERYVVETTEWGGSLGSDPDRR